MLLLVGGLLLALAPRNLARHRVGRRRENIDEIRLLTTIVSALRAGHSLRNAIAESLQDDPHFAAAGRLARIGAPIGEVGKALAGLPTNGRRISAALTVLEMTGGQAAAVFDRLLVGAVRHADVARQRRQLTAQARASALVVAALPVVAIALSGGSQLISLARSGAVGLTMAAAGVLLQAVGLLIVWRLAR
jgi:Flp pilus assembly protein TadB